MRDMYFLTDGTEWINPSVSTPNVNSPYWQLCNYKARMINEKYILRCIFGEKERLVDRFGIRGIRMNRLLVFQQIYMNGNSKWRLISL